MALLGALLGGAGSSPGHALNLRLPLAVAAAGYLLALALAAAAIRPQRPSPKNPSEPENPAEPSATIAPAAATIAAAPRPGKCGTRQLCPPPGH